MSFHRRGNSKQPTQSLVQTLKDREGTEQKWVVWISASSWKNIHTVFLSSLGESMTSQQEKKSMWRQPDLRPCISLVKWWAGLLYSIFIPLFPSLKHIPTLSLHMPYDDIFTHTHRETHTLASCRDWYTGEWPVLPKLVIMSLWSTANKKKRKLISASMLSLLYTFLFASNPDMIHTTYWRAHVFHFLSLMSICSWL